MQISQLNTSVPHKDHTIAAPKIPQFNTKILQFNTKIPQFNTKNPLVKHKNFVSFTPKTLQFHTAFGNLNWGVFRVALRGFQCGIEGILGAKKGWSFCVELLCWTEGVWNWEGPIAELFTLRYYKRKIQIIFLIIPTFIELSLKSCDFSLWLRLKSA